MICPGDRVTQALTELPAQLFALTELKQLSLSCAQITNLRPLLGRSRPGRPGIGAHLV